MSYATTGVQAEKIYFDDNSQDGCINKVKKT